MSLFDEDHVYLPAAPTDTQREAAEKFLGKSATLRRKVYEVLKSWPMIDDELFVMFTNPANSIRPRRKELVDAGLVIDSGLRKKNAHGNTCIVWKAVEL